MVSHTGRSRWRFLHSSGRNYIVMICRYKSSFWAYYRRPICIPPSPKTLRWWLIIVNISKIISFWVRGFLIKEIWNSSEHFYFYFLNYASTNKLNYKEQILNQTHKLVRKPCPTPIQLHWVLLIAIITFNRRFGASCPEGWQLIYDYWNRISVSNRETWWAHEMTGRLGRDSEKLLRIGSSTH